jgi:transposase-like protein
LVDEQLADELLGRAEGVELLGPGGLLSQVRNAVLERDLGEELTHDLGYEERDSAGRGSGNSRNGRTGKRLLTEVGSVDLKVQRDRSGGVPRFRVVLVAAGALVVFAGSGCDSTDGVGFARAA